MSDAGLDPREDERIKRVALLSLVWIGMVAGTLWGALYAWLGLPGAGAIPGGHAIVSAVSLVLYRATGKNYALLSRMQIVQVLLLPFLLQWALGGFAASSAVMIWALMSPVGALMFYGPRAAKIWFALFLGLALVSGLLEPVFAEHAAQLSPGIRTAFFVMNVFGASTAVFVPLIYFVGERDRAQARTRELLVEVQETLDDLHRTQAQLVESEKQAMLGRLVAGIVHEVNTPLGALRSSADTIRRSVDRAKENLTGPELASNPNATKAIRALDAMRELTRVLMESSDRIRALAESLGRFVSLDRAELRDFDIIEGLESTIVLVSANLTGNRTIARDLGEGPVLVRCEPSRLNQVFLNVFDNAAKAIGEGGTIAVRLDRAQPQRIAIIISDDGPGIPPAELPHIFDFGFTKRSGQRVGLRLGLPTAKNIVTDLGGTLTIESAEGKGTTVRIELPRS